MREDVGECAGCGAEEGAETGGDGGVDGGAGEAAAVLFPECVPAGGAAARAGFDGLFAFGEGADFGLDEDDEAAWGEDAGDFFEEEGVVADLINRMGVGVRVRNV